MSVGITPKQRECLDYVADYQRQFGHAPSYRRIMDAIGLKSVSGAFRLIVDLETRGYVKRAGRKAHALEILNQDLCPHCGYGLGSSDCRDAAANKITYSSTPAQQVAA